MNYALYEHKLLTVHSRHGCPAWSGVEMETVAKLFVHPCFKPSLIVCGNLILVTEELVTGVEQLAVRVPQPPEAGSGHLSPLAGGEAGEPVRSSLGGQLRHHSAPGAEP